MKTNKTFKAQPGDVLYHDFTTSTYLRLDKSKMPIGCVVDVRHNGQELRAVSLDISPKPLSWADDYNFESFSEDVLQPLNCLDYDGKHHTLNIITKGLMYGIETPAAQFCFEYQTPGTNRGDWHLPGIDELSLCRENFTQIRKLQQRCGKPLLLSDDMTFWSSSEFTYKQARYLIFNDMRHFIRFRYDNKNTLKEVWPMICLQAN